MQRNIFVCLSLITVAALSGQPSEVETFVPQTTTGVSYSRSQGIIRRFDLETGDLREVLFVGKRNQLKSTLSGSAAQSRCESVWHEDVYAAGRILYSCGQQRWITNDTGFNWTPLPDLPTGQIVIASRFSESSPRRLVVTTNTGDIVVSEFADDDQLRHESKLSGLGLPAGVSIEDFAAADIRFIGTKGSIPVVLFGKSRNSLQWIATTLAEKGGEWSFEALPQPGRADDIEVSLNSDLQFGEIQVNGSGWLRSWRWVDQDVEKGGWEGAWSFNPGTKSNQLNAAQACVYNSQLRDHTRNAWDNYLDFGAGNHEFWRMIKYVSGNRSTCSPKARIPATAAIFTRVELSRSGVVQGDWNVKFIVNRYGGRTFRQRVLVLDQPQVGYPGLLVTLTQIGSSTNSCQAFPLTTGLRAPALAEFNPSRHSIVRVFINYTNPNCPRSGDFVAIACGRDVQSGGMLTFPVQTAPRSSADGTDPDKPSFAAQQAADSKQTSSTTTCAVDMDMTTGHFH